MKPVLIQHLMKHNKGRYKPAPVTEKEREQHDKALGKFVFWFVFCCHVIVLGKVGNLDGHADGTFLPSR